MGIGDINIGCYAHRFQDGLFDGLWLFCATLRRVVSLMDQSANLTNRHRTAYPIFPNDVEKKDLLKNIYKLMTSNGVFQFAGHNCARPVQKNTAKCIKNLPNYSISQPHSVKWELLPWTGFLLGPINKEAGFNG